MYMFLCIYENRNIIWREVSVLVDGVMVKCSQSICKRNKFDHFLFDGFVSGFNLWKIQEIS